MSRQSHILYTMYHPASPGILSSKQICGRVGVYFDIVTMLRDNIYSFRGLWRGRGEGGGVTITKYTSRS